jgi:hypothetical protein
MAEQTFKSPNFYSREMDLSATSVAEPTGVPAAIIGTSNKGPAFVPVTSSDFNQFTHIFGNLDPKHFGPYAVNEFLKNKSALTYVRVLGAGSNSSEEDLSDTLQYGRVKNAGFTLPGQAAVAGDNRHKGIVQFLVAQHTITSKSAYGMPTFYENDTIDGASQVDLVRGMVMTPSTARIMIHANSSISAVNATLDDSAVVDSNKKFKIIISSSLGASFSTTDGLPGVKTLLASFDPSDPDYFGKIMNTDPDKFYQEQHYLHADFAVDPNIAYVNAADSVAVLSGSSNTSSNGDASKTFREVFGSYNTRFTAPKTTNFISQPFGSTEYDLFRFEALDDGEFANSLYKISISNVRASTNDAYKYGTFNVQIRDWNDTDNSVNIIEQFTNCSLDPNAKNYIAKMIGDRKVFYNFDAMNLSEKRLVATGKYPNMSKYVRVIMNEAVEKAAVPSNALPFGFRGPSLLNINKLLSVSDELPVSEARLTGQLSAGDYHLSSSFIPPLPFRFKVTRGDVAHPPMTVSFIGEPGPREQTNISLYWGVKFERSSTSSDYDSDSIYNANASSEKDCLIESFTKFFGVEKLDTLVTGSSADQLHNNKFSLSKVALYNTSISDLTSSINSHMKSAAYIRNAVLDSTDYTWTDDGRRRITLATLLSSGSASDFNKFSSYAKFTNFMYGGFDGTNFLDRDARRLNDKSVSFDDGGGASETNDISGFISNPAGQGQDNNGVASYLSAVDILTNPQEANNNLLAIPGIREPYVTDQTMKKVRDYGLSLYIMDIPSYSDAGSRMYDSATIKPSINQTVNNLDGRSIDNNYVATYYPDIFVDDATNKRKVKVPASVAALSALSFNDRVSYPWFAPAGFNRAALDFVQNVDVRLSVADRDRLSESRINPIATFPRLGYVIYGQKTLQISKSALDRVNVRRLMLEIKRIIVGIAQKIVFEQNTPAVRNKFVADAAFQLSLIQTQAGVEAFQVVMNESNNTQADVDLNVLNGRIIVVPTRVIEFIGIDFIVSQSGVNFI